MHLLWWLWLAWDIDNGSHGGHVMIMLLVDRWWICGGARLEMEGVVAAAVVVLLEAGAARGGEWCGGSYRPEEGKYFWGSPEKLAEKVFRPRRWPAGGRK
nr:hypothetical protein [Tanacetum cinerariifolium]